MGREGKNPVEQHFSGCLICVEVVTNAKAQRRGDAKGRTEPGQLNSTEIPLLSSLRLSASAPLR
ncbi:MAG: hypothetical protein JWP89_3983 [Schlesneria sp.]|nr:hypothetical protein [Schlesneria sp.]